MKSETVIYLMMFTSILDLTLIALIKDQEQDETINPNILIGMVKHRVEEEINKNGT